MIMFYFYKILYNYLNRWCIIYIKQLNYRKKTQCLNIIWYMSNPIYNGTYMFSEALEKLYWTLTKMSWTIHWRMEIFVFKD